uniref:Uncharacterized protein n=1 Tax=Chromera velia CCMP2878 TaxID=1169474 RepID=A0A0G4I266_9ALVE|eukprot:Cvel_10322.t1-p1 / transcript=Cvel_10322.t1 / gene=Cvel_10322 / organism=Chromera_velia_CCMP2878 / gene_product=hypothetical protein / transcript_product=hypothetical protein / location=Cvel_scaffold620:11460-15983(+) / protein_length=248 / sequence_SO=supercontig / SO=protein_coding / is_pseudo=false
MEKRHTLLTSGKVKDNYLTTMSVEIPPRHLPILDDASDAPSSHPLHGAAASPAGGNNGNEGVRGIEGVDFPEQHGADVPANVYDRFTGLFIRGPDNKLTPLVITGKFRKSTHVTSKIQQQPNGKWKFIGLSNTTVRKTDVLRYFEFARGHLLPAIEVEISSPPSAQGSTQTPALPEEVARGDFDVACRDKWLKNIVGKGVLGRVVDRKEVDSVMQIGWRLTWKEKEAQQAEKEKEENRQEEEKAAQSR